MNRLILRASIILFSLGLLVPATLVAPRVTQAAPAPTSPPAVCSGGFLSVSPSTVVGLLWGGGFAATLGGFEANAPFSVFLGSSLAASGQTDVNGNASLQVGGMGEMDPGSLTITAATAGRCGQTSVLVVPRAECFFIITRLVDQIGGAAPGTCVI